MVKENTSFVEYKKAFFLTEVSGTFELRVSPTGYNSLNLQEFDTGP